jgi:hypothetical protein
MSELYLDRLPWARPLRGGTSYIVFKNVVVFCDYYQDFILFIITSINWGHAVTQLVEALCYKPEGRGFDSW